MFVFTKQAFWLWALGLSVQGLRFMAYGLGLRDYGLGHRAKGLVFRV